MSAQHSGINFGKRPTFKTVYINNLYGYNQLVNYSTIRKKHFYFYLIAYVICIIVQELAKQNSVNAS